VRPEVTSDVRADNKTLYFEQAANVGAAAVVTFAQAAIGETMVIRAADVGEPTSLRTAWIERRRSDLTLVIGVVVVAIVVVMLLRRRETIEPKPRPARTH
jgi:ABC-type antimicrobial peptide transport system permease subunit